MRIKLLTGAATVAMAVSLPTMAMALDAVATTDLNMRAGPGPEHEIVGTIGSNDPVEILGCLPERNWCQVSWQGQQGWSYSDYLAVTQADERMLVPQARTVLDIPAATFSAASDAATGVLEGVGTIIGSAAGLASGVIEAVTPPTHVRSYVIENRREPVLLRGEVVVGAMLPGEVQLYEVPDYRYHYAYVNGVPVLVDPGTRQIVHVYRAG